MTPATAREVIAETIAPLTEDMERVAPRLWVKPLTDEHRATLAISAWKGATFTLTYGVCCTWVPHRHGDAWRWHRTLKQSRTDMRIDHFAAGSPSFVPVSWLDQPGVIARNARSAMKQVTKPARAWWQSVATIEGVAREANRQSRLAEVIVREQMQIVAAFTHARLGDLECARSLLDSIESLIEEPPVLLAAHAKLESVVRR